MSDDRKPTFLDDYIKATHHPEMPIHSLGGEAGRRDALAAREAGPGCAYALIPLFLISALAAGVTLYFEFLAALIISSLLAPLAAVLTLPLLTASVRESRAVRASALYRKSLLVCLTSFAIAALVVAWYLHDSLSSGWGLFTQIVSSPFRSAKTMLASGILIAGPAAAYAFGMRGVVNVRTAFIAGLIKHLLLFIMLLSIIRMVVKVSG